MGSSIDLVADIGESFGSWTMGDDAHILRTLTSANIACGFHAGDPRVMARSVALCREHDVAVGAHPSFPDLVGFGRRAMELSREEISSDVVYQVGALQAFARVAGTTVTHVSPHGRLGTLVATDRHYAQGVADAVEQLDPTLTVLTMNGELEQEARERGLPVVVYGLVDRNLEDDGTLVSRRDPEALVHDEDALVERALSMVLDGSVTSRHGRRVEVRCESLLLHGDNPASVRTAERIRAALEDAGVEIAAFTNPCPLSRVAARFVSHEYGDAALLVDILDDDPTARWEATRDLGELFRTAGVPGVVDVVASFVNVFVQFDPLVTDHAAIEAAVAELSHRPVTAYDPKEVEVPVVYGGEHGPDLDSVADALSLSATEVVELHSAEPWTVRFVGSPLGAPLMDGPRVPASVPRLATPRVRMEPGSVGMSGVQSIIYNAASPGGWRIVGRTPRALFDVDREPHVPYRAGDTIRFRPVEADQ